MDYLAHFWVHHDGVGVATSEGRTRGHECELCVSIDRSQVNNRSLEGMVLHCFVECSAGRWGLVAENVQEQHHEHDSEQ